MSGFTSALALSVAITIPQNTSAHTGDTANLFAGLHDSPVIIAQPRVDYKERFLSIIEGYCALPEKIQQTPEGYPYYPDVGFQFNVMTKKLELCNGGAPERLGISNMEIFECGMTYLTQEYICTLLNENGANPLCIITNQDGNIRKENGACREVFSPKN